MVIQPTPKFAVVKLTGARRLHRPCAEMVRRKVVDRIRNPETRRGCLRKPGNVEADDPVPASEICNAALSRPYRTADDETYRRAIAGSKAGGARTGETEWHGRQATSRRAVSNLPPARRERGGAQGNPAGSEKSRFRGSEGGGCGLRRGEARTGQAIHAAPCDVVQPGEVGR